MNVEREKKILFENVARSLWYKKCNGNVREETNGETFEKDFLPNIYTYLGKKCYLKGDFDTQLNDFLKNN